MKKKDRRKKEIKFRKNIVWLIMLIFLLWLGLAGMIYFIEPSTFLAIPVFFLAFFIACLFTLSLLFSNTRRGVLASCGILAFLILRYLGVGNILNLLLISAIVIATEFYFTRE